MPGIDETEEEFRVRLRDPNDFQPESFRRIVLQSEKPRVFGIVGRLKDETTTTLQALRFPKEDDWTRDSVRRWLDDHPDIGKGYEPDDAPVEAADVLPGTDDLWLQRLKAPAAGEVVYKFYRASAIKAIDRAKYMVDVTISTAALDRDKEIVRPEGMRLPRPRRVPLVSSHDYRELLKHIGTVEKISAEGETVTARIRYFAGLGNQEADWGWTLVEQGVAAYSIGFIPEKFTDADLNDEKLVEQIQAGKKPMRTYDVWELVEASHVIVPSNRGAIQQTLDAAIAKGVLTVAEGKSILPLFTDPASKAPDPDPVLDLLNPGTERLLIIQRALHLDAEQLEAQADVIKIRRDGVLLFEGTPTLFVEAVRRAAVLAGVELTIAPAAIAIDADGLTEVLTTWAEAFLIKFEAALDERATAIPTLPKDSAAFTTHQDLIAAVVEAAQKIAHAEVAAQIGRALGNVDYYRNRAR